MNELLGKTKISNLVWKICVPMIFSMMLLAAYTVIDASFVVNMGPEGVNANLAITYAFPVQIMSASLGVGIGIGINALLSKSLGEKNYSKAAKIAGNGLFAGSIIWVIFVIFAIFFAKPFIKMQAGDNQEAIKMGVDYLKITCILSFGQIGFTVSERFLQSTGLTLYSTIAQISGSVINIVLDYVFIYICGLGVAGAAWATIIGQIVSFILAYTFHLIKNKDIKIHFKDLLPSGTVLKEIYSVGWSASIMQGLVSLSMLGTILILGLSSSNDELVKGSYGIYYKIAQFALFACFGMSNGIITIMAYNYGSKDKTRCKECLKYGLVMTFIVTGVLTVIFETLANPMAKLFALSGGATEEIASTVALALRISAISFIFMGMTISIQGMLQAFRDSIKPLILSLLRYAIILFPLIYGLSLTNHPWSNVWFAFPITEIITSAVSVVMIIFTFRKMMKTIDNQ